MNLDKAARRSIAPLRQYIKRHNLIEEGDKVLLACSGGADSLALLYMLAYLREQLHFDLVVAHVDHQLRVESAADALAVAEIANTLQLTCQIAKVEAAAWSQQQGFSVQEAARVLRYRELWKISQNFSCNKTAVAHHCNDQAETVLINLCRGTSGAGFTAMSKQRLLRGREIASFLQQSDLKMNNQEWHIIRPLIKYSRQQIDSFCQQLALPIREDSSNSSDKYLRNRVRRQLLPLLEESIRAGAVKNIARAADWLTDEVDCLQNIAASEFARIARCENNIWQIEREQFNCLHIAIKRYFIAHLWRELYGVITGCEAVYIEDICNLSAQKGRLRQVDWPQGRRLSIEKDHINIYKQR